MGGNFSHRTNNKGKVRVPKGMTCESNPQKSRHRAAAHSARNASMMTRDHVAVEDRAPVVGASEGILNTLSLDAMSLGGGGEKNVSSSKSMVSEGGLSRLSEFTSCTNPAFDSVHRMWKSGSSMQTEVISVLAAVAELIRERNGTESDVEYFAALLTALEGAPLGDCPRTAATAFLLQMIVKKVPKEILQAQFTKTTQILYTKLLENNESSDGAVLKNLLSVLGVVLRAQPAAVWQSANIRNMVVSVASLCTHDKPWVRTMSRRVVRAVLTDPVTAMDNGLHAASSGVGQFVLTQLEAALASKNGAMNAVRFLCLLEGVMHKMPSNLFKQLSEAILKSFAFADPMVKCSALQCMHRSLQRQPCDAALPIETNVLLVNALKQLTPPTSDIAVCAYWMQALTEAHVCLTAKSPSRCYLLLPETLQLLVKMFDAANEQVAQVTYQVLSRLIERCVQDNEDCARRLLTLLDQALNLQSTAVWKFVLRCQMRLFEAAGEGIVGPEFKAALESLAQLRQSDSCFCKAELDFTIGSAVRHVGAGPVLDVLSLSIDADAVVLSTEFPRSWLIPVLRVNLHNAPLSLFSSFFLPLAVKIYRRLPSLDPLPQRLYTTLQSQIWELLPSFCESPSDFEKSFPALAPVLGAALNERKDLRLTVLSALRRALKFVLQPDAPNERREVMSRYAKNFMPLLFNMYTNSTVEGEYDDKGVRLAVLETVRVYSEVTPGELVTKFIKSAIAKWAEAGEGTGAEAKKSRILDILCALVRFGDGECIANVLNTIHPWFSASESVGLQKKAYRILEEILTCKTSPALVSVLESRAEDIENAVVRPIASVKPPARAALVNCIHSMLQSISELKSLTDFALKTFESVILTLDKSNSTHARSTASKCLQFICTHLIEVGAETEQHPSSVLNPILSRIYELATPLSGDNSEVPLDVARSTLVALSIIAQKQMKVLNATLMSRIVSHGCGWIGDGRAPVRILAIRLLRVLAQKMPDFAMHQYRDLLLTSVFDGQLTCDLTVKVRKANRLLLEVLVEKFGIEVLEKYTKKADWVKQMKNIEKIRRRKAAKAQGQGDKGDSNEEDNVSSAGSRLSSRTAGADTILELLEDSDADEDSEVEMETRSRVSSVWLREDEDGETTDLLDRSNMINKVTTTDPALLARRKAKSLEKKKDTGFKFTKDGKIIIVDDEEDEVKKKTRKRKNGLDELDEDMPLEGGKKRKDDSDLESDYEDSDDDGRPAKSVARSTVTTASSSWKPGGKGIHRDTGKGGKKGNGDSTKPGQKVQPYAYVPLRGKGGGKQDIRKLLKAQRKSGKADKRRK